jgi:uncharacterized membrane protein
LFTNVRESTASGRSSNDKREKASVASRIDVDPSFELRVSFVIRCSSFVIAVMTVSRFRTILFTVAAIVALAGLADATYLSVQALTGETLSCGGSPDCFRVLGSSYAKVGGIPVAMLGALAYLSVFAFATFAAFGYVRARTLLIAIVGAMFLATLWFLYVQAFVLHAYCRYCLFSAAITFLLAGLVIAVPSSQEQ